MSRVEHDQWTRIGVLGIMLRLAGRMGPPRPVIERKIAQEGVAVRRNEIEDEPRRLAIDRIDDEGLFDADWSGSVQHDARATLHYEPEPIGLDQAPAALADPGGHPERHLRQVDHDPVGIGQGEGVHLHAFAQVEDEARARAVAAEPRVACNRNLGRAGAHRPGGSDYQQHASPFPFNYSNKQA